MDSQLSNAAAKQRALLQTATAGLIERDQVAELVVLAAVAKEHLLIVGPPGTAKSAVVRRVAQSWGGRYFEYLLGRFTEPAEIFGPMDLRKLREGVLETDTTGMLPQADVAFLDEVFLGSTAILNTLLGVLNERRYRRGHTDIDCPLRVCIGASNALPQDESLAAFADRFLLRLFIDPVPDHQLEALLAGGWLADNAPRVNGSELTDLDVLSAAVPNVDLHEVRGPLANAIRKLRSTGLELSDRRLVKLQRLIAAATVLAGRNKASEADLWPLFYVLPTREAQTSAQELLRDSMRAAANPNLRSAVEHAVLQPVSRVARLIEAAQSCLSDPTQAATPAMRTIAEALLREIDANFNAHTIPPPLAAERARLLQAVSAA